MTRKEQNKILNDKIESNINQYKVDKLNAEISAFSSDDLSKYEFLTRKDLNYKPNALDKARFEFSPLGQTFSTGLDKTDQDYQEEGVIKLLKDIRDSVAGDNRPNDDGNDGNEDGNDDGNDRNDGNDGNDDGNDGNNENDGNHDGNDGNDGNDDIKRKLDTSITEYNNLLLEYNQMGGDMKKTKDELNIVKDDSNKKEEIINNFKQEV